MGRGKKKKRRPFLIDLRIRAPRGWRGALALLALAAAVCGGCRSCFSKRAAGVRRVRVTGYCDCGICCGWERDAVTGGPVYTYGKLKGMPKEVGRTAAGTRARHGTVAADWSVFPKGTRLSIPGYGVGFVEDTGGAIKGAHIDVWFPSHETALKWGSRTLDVSVVK